MNKFSKYFLILGATGYGGPNALAEKMRRFFVDETKAISETEFEKGFSLSQLLPGPLAGKLCVYLMYKLEGIGSAAKCLSLFVLPSCLFIFFFAFLYREFGMLEAFQKISRGAAPAVLALTLWSLIAPSKRQIMKDRFILFLLYILVFIFFFVIKLNLALMLLLGGLLYASIKIIPRTATLHSANWIVFSQSLIAGGLVFGGGNAIIPFFETSFVTQHGFLTEKQFLDGLTLGLLTPGPVLVAATFFGFLATGPIGALVGTVGVFLPSILIVLIAARFYEKLIRNKFFFHFSIGATVSALAATFGAILNLCINNLSGRIEIGLFVAGLFLVALKRIPDMLIVAICAFGGYLLF